MDLEAPPQVEEEAVWRFTIPSSDPLGRPIIAINDATFDYNSDIVRDDGTKKPVSEYLLQKINFGVDNASKIGKKPLYFVVVVVVVVLPHENQIKSNQITDFLYLVLPTIAIDLLNFFVLTSQSFIIFPHRI